jgi:Uma2 family endonuclease
VKAPLYARARLPEYWIVNLVDEVVEVHRRPEPEPDSVCGAVYREVETLARSAAISPLGAPMARLSLDDLLLMRSR